MKQDKQEKLLCALNDVGDDLVTKAADCRYAPSPWKRWGAVAASLALVISLTALALPYFPIGCKSANDMAESEQFPTADGDRNESADQNSSIEAPMDDQMADPKEPSYGFSDDAVFDAIASMDLEYLTQAVAVPLIRWQVGSFASAADLSEDGMERLYLAVMERDEPFRDPAAASVAEIRKKLSQVLEGTHIYAPLNSRLPLDGALKELPEIYPEHLYVEGQTAVLSVQVGNRHMRITIVLDDGSWRYVSVY